VDAEPRVRDVEGLRIDDASVVPTIPSAGTNAASVMIGEFASRLVVAEQRAFRGRRRPSRRPRSRNASANVGATCYEKPVMPS
jgi:choline dehydrogenase-like flavoprotein